MMADQLEVVAQYLNSIEANLIKNELETEGIRAFVIDDASSTMLSYIAPATHGAKIVVAGKDAKLARAVILNLPFVAPSEFSGEGDAAVIQPSATPEPWTDEPPLEQRRSWTAMLAGRQHESLSYRESETLRALIATFVSFLIPPLLIFSAYILSKVIMAQGPLRPAYMVVIAVAALLHLLIAWVWGRYVVELVSYWGF